MDTADKSLPLGGSQSAWEGKAEYSDNHQNGCEITVGTRAIQKRYVEL